MSNKVALKTDGLGYQFSGAALNKFNAQRKAIYSHALDFDAERVLCGGAKFHMFLDDPEIADPAPTCPNCRKRLGLT